MMKQIGKYIVAVLVVLVVLISCKGEPSLQEYYVDNQNNDNFISLDIPASMVDVGDDVSQETKETMHSIKKLNVLAFKIDKGNEGAFHSEVKKVKEILKLDKYSELIRMKHKNANIIVKFLGNDDAVDEFILFASDNNKGFALARVLGKDMDPEKIIKMTKDLKNMDANGEILSQFKGILGDFESK